MDAKPEGIRELAFHIDRLNSWSRDLWATKSIDLHMSDGTVRMDQFGLLQDIRMDIMALRAAVLEAVLALPLDGGDGQVPGMPDAICHACGLGIRCSNEHCPNARTDNLTDTTRIQPNGTPRNRERNVDKAGEIDEQHG